MARNTRQQRRRRRDKQRQEATPKEQGVAQRARTRQQAVRPAQQAAKTQTGRRGGRGGGRFISESWAELKKVEWPGQRQVLTGTVVVIIACAIVGFYLWAADFVLQPFVERLLLGR